MRLRLDDGPACVQAMTLLHRLYLAGALIALSWIFEIAKHFCALKGAF